MIDRKYIIKSNSTITFLKEVIVIDNFASTIWNVSNAVPKVITLPDGLIQIKIEIFPNGRNALDENYISISATLLPNNTYNYYTTSTKFSVLTAKKILRNELSAQIYWQAHDLIRWEHPRFVSRQLCLDVNEGMLIDGKLNILAHIIMLPFHYEVEQSIIQSSLNLVEIVHVWSVCNLIASLNATEMKIMSTKFPFDGEFVKFSLHMALQGEFGSKPEHISLFNCLVGNDYPLTKPLLVLNFTFKIKNYERDTGTINLGPFSHAYDAAANSCWGEPNALLFGVAMKSPCLMIEFHGIYRL